MKKPKVGDIVTFKNGFISTETKRKEFKVISIGKYGFFVESPWLSTGRYYTSFDEDFEIKQPEKPDYLSIFSLVAVIAIVLLLIFSSVYFKL